MNKLYILDYKGNINPNNPAVIRRHQGYGSSYQNLMRARGEYAKLIVLTQNEQGKNFHSSELDVISVTKVRSTLTFIQKSFKIISEEKSEKIGLIAGDPWKSTLIIILLRILIKRPIKLESQVHFDFNGFFKRWNFIGERVLFRLTLGILRSVNQVRVVDFSTLKLLKTKLKNSGHIYLAPSLLNINPKFVCLPKIRNQVPILLFVGRLHPERNPSDFLKILRVLHNCHYQFRAKLIGTGPLFNELSKSSFDLTDAGLLEILGECVGDDLYRQLCTADILISCASHESYGRAMREALFYGVKVLSRETEGCKLLCKEFGTEVIGTFDMTESAQDLVNKIEKLRLQNVELKTRTVIANSQSKILDDLAKAWANLTNP